MEITEKTAIQEITEGSAKIHTAGKVFYNPVQEFNRDLSITVLTVFIEEYLQQKNVELTTPTGKKCENGVSILEALSATGLRSIRYAKEIPGIREIIANDLSIKAVEDIRGNIRENHVDDLVIASHEDATDLMYKNRKEKRFDAIDLDPYGCPSIFLDSAVQAIKDGGLLLITATDMAVLAGNSPETCYSKYGAISLRVKACHEMAIRILLQCIETHANRYSRYIVPLLSISADFYIRVFVRVFTSAKTCKKSLSKLSLVNHCVGCGSFILQPLGVVKFNDKNQQLKYSLPTHQLHGTCEHCNNSYHTGGPIWNSPIHDAAFIAKLIDRVSDKLTTHRRIQGVLSVINEELPNVPLYYTLEQLSGTLHVETPPMAIIRSALLNAGYQVSYTHMNKTSIKTNAPTSILWDIMKYWEKDHPISKKRSCDNSPGCNILKKPCMNEYSFVIHPDANPESRKLGFLRFQQNPLPNWGPGTRSTALIGDQKMDKSRLKQGKKRKHVSPPNPD